MNMKIYIISILLFILALSCNKNTIEPDANGIGTANRIVKYTKYDSSLEFKEENRFLYEDNKCTHTIHREDGSIVSTYIYEYDNDGNKIKEWCYTTELVLSYYIEYEYE